MSMGFDKNVCVNAIKAVKSEDLEVIMNYIITHLEELNTPIKKETDIDTEIINNIKSILPLPDKVIIKALKETHNNSDQAIEWLFNHPDAEKEILEEEKDNSDKIEPLKSCPKYKLSNVIAHRGTSVMCGHYVAMNHIDDKWYLYNDDEIVVHPNPPIGEGYIFIYSSQ